MRRRVPGAADVDVANCAAMRRKAPDAAEPGVPNESSAPPLADVPAMPPQEYFMEIEAHFAARRGTPFILSAKDWSLMKEWRDSGIPLPVVIEAIDSVFEKNEASGRRRVISSLSYCRHAIKEIWHERRELVVGEASTTPESAPVEALELLAAELELVPESIAASFVPRLRELARERSVPRIEEQLIVVERELIDALLASLSPEVRDEVARSVASTLGDISKLDEKTRARTEEANLRRIVRERFALPRLTLFR